MITILTAYSPHTQKFKNNSKELDELYCDINTTITSIKNSSDTKSDIILIGGDLNAKIGKSLNSNNNQDLCIGRQVWTVTYRLVQYTKLVRLQHNVPTPSKTQKYMGTIQNQQNKEQVHPYLQSDQLHYLSSRPEENFD